ncbi:MAG: acyl carrier protein [Nitrospira sp.]|nr:acyl carrier protein [Nitrospira sp.]
MVSKDNLTHTILQIIQETLQAKNIRVRDLGLDSPVDSGLGLDSLDWAAVVVRLEMETGIDPFATGSAGALKTVSDLVDLYKTEAR